MTDSAKYLLFLNNLDFITKFIHLKEINSHPINHLSGWQGIKSLTCIDQKEELYDIDIRYAWDSVIFQQNLIDHGWTESNLLTPKKNNETNRHKLIIYLCQNNLTNQISNKLTVVPERFLIGNYWQTVNHCYLLLSENHPFDIQIKYESFNFNYYHKQEFLTKDKPNNSLETKLVLPSPFPLQKEGGLSTKGLYKITREKNPLISVITVVFNGEKYLEQTIQSIINNSYPNLEYIVIDGGSTDNSLEIIKKYDSYIDYWISEPDKGVYDGMNKGTILASGDYTLHINADDLLFDSQCLVKAIEEIQSKHQLESSNLLSSILFYRLDKKTLTKKEPKTPQQDPNLNIVKLPGGHQGFLGIRNKLSIFDSNSYKIVAERVVMSEKIKKEIITVSRNTLAICRSGGISYGINFAMLNEIKKATNKSRNPQVFLSLFREYLRLALLWFGKITGLLKLKYKISQ